MKKLLTLILILGIGFGGYLLISNTKGSGTTQDSLITEQETYIAPERPAEINGVVQTVEGNSIVISNEVGKEQLSEEERDKRKDALQELSQEERQALRQQELEETETQDMEMLIPVGIPVTKGSGTSSGETVLAEISDIEKGMYLSMWVTEGGSIEFVKIKGIGQ